MPRNTSEWSPDMKTVVRLLLAAVGLAAAVASAQTYPVRPVKAIVPFGAGGQGDVVARVVTQKLSERWGQPVVVENRVGASGNIGTEAAATAAPGGRPTVRSC